ncbi:MAG TPA: helix-turn-helix domain-containing protein [Nocardioides sp.]|nr:helix-turn-helix domain-containing protein [Nocardioides sp.]
MVISVSPSVPSPGPEVAPEVRDLSRRLLADAERLGRLMADRICAEIPEYAARPDDRASVDASCTDNVRYILGQLAGDRPVSLDSPRATGATRAAQGFPYAAVLQAFRIGGRYVWELLVEHAGPEEQEVLLRAAADIWAVSDDLAVHVTDAYRRALADRVRRDTQQRSVVVGALLDGDPGGMQGENVLALDGGRGFVVVAAETPGPGQDALGDVERLLRRTNVASAWRLDRDHQEGVVALRVGYDVDALTASLAELATGRVGVSRVFTSLEDTTRARQQARVACAAATPGAVAVVRFEQHPLAVLLASSPDQARQLAEAVLGPVLALPGEDRDVVIETARTWLAVGGSTSTAARELHVHRNTVRYRVRRLEEVTGRDLAQPVDAAELYVALECARILGLA